MNAKQEQPKRKSSAAAVFKPRRRPRETTVRLLYVRAGGRCEFDGCNRYLLEHPLNKKRGNYGEVAHIVAFKRGGARGEEAIAGDIHDPDNLMLLCDIDHREVDQVHPADYTVETLKSYKKAHEKRIRHLTSLGPDRETRLVQLVAKIGGHTPVLPFQQLVEAVSPRYPDQLRDGALIDLSGIATEDSQFFQVAAKEITRRVEALFDPPDVPRHLSVFALAPMPILVHFGAALGNKIPADFYQRHRNSEEWRWKEGGAQVEYEIKRTQVGTNRSRVALVLSLSGTIDRGRLPPEIDNEFYIYEMTLSGRIPNPTFLKMREDLDAFRDSYQACLRRIEQAHDGLSILHLFPAAPAPIMVLVGRERLPKVDPTLRVYDQNKTGFYSALDVY